MLIQCYVQVVTLRELHIPPHFNLYLVIDKCIQFSFFKIYLVIISATSNLVLLVTSMQSKHSPEVWQIPLETSCVVIKKFERRLNFLRSEIKTSQVKRYIGQASLVVFVS